MVLPNENVTEGAMSNDDEMTINERRKYLRKMQKRYRKASEKERSMLLDEMQQITSMHRKSLIRLINGDLARRPFAPTGCARRAPARTGFESCWGG